MSTVRIDIDQAAVQGLLHSPAGPVVRRVERYTTRTEAAAKAGAPVDEGQLRASIDSAVTVQPGRVVGRVGSPLPQAVWTSFGTGIYGPKKRPITPKHGRWLVFEPGRSMGPPRSGGRHRAKGKRGPLVFATSVKGTPPNPYFYEALVMSVPWPVRVLRPEATKRG